MLKIRCSAIGKIMTNSRSKSEVLSKTCKSYLQELAIEEMYGIKKEFSSRFTDKGIEVERESIDLVQEVSDYGFMYKNEEFFENDFLTGTPDVNTDNILLDVKSSYDASTFPFFAEDIPNKDYYYQLQGYMALCNKRKSVLAYCLVNTPFQIVEDEVRRAHWKEHLIDDTKDADSTNKHDKNEQKPKISNDRFKEALIAIDDKRYTLERLKREWTLTPAQLKQL